MELTVVSSFTELVNTNDGSIIVPLYDRLVGRFTKRDIFHPETGELIIAHDELINEAIATQIVEAGIKEVEIRTVFTCNR